MKVLLIVFFSCLQLFAYSLKIQGVLKEPYELSKKQFQALKQTTLKDVSVVCSSGKEMKKPKNLNGVLLKQLVQKASINLKNKKKFNQIILLATASDNYAVAFSYNELFNTTVGDEVLVVYENESFSLYSKKDLVTGPRHVYNLTNIKIIYID